jgi:hypothetical protein
MHLARLYKGLLLNYLTLFFAASGRLDLRFFKAVPKKEEESTKFEKIAIPQKMSQLPFVCRWLLWKNLFFIFVFIAFLGPTRKYSLVFFAYMESSQRSSREVNKYNVFAPLCGSVARWHHHAFSISNIDFKLLPFLMVPHVFIVQFRDMHLAMPNSYRYSTKQRK